MSNEVEDLVKELKSQLLDDDLEISWIVDIAKANYSPRTAEDLKQLVLSAIGRVVQEKAGVMKDFRRNPSPQWIQWPGDGGDAVKEIKRRWDLLGREPIFPLGELGWLITTAKFKNFSVEVVDTISGIKQTRTFKAIDLEDAKRRSKKGLRANEIVGEPVECK